MKKKTIKEMLKVDDNQGVLKRLKEMEETLKKLDNKLKTKEK